MLTEGDRVKVNHGDYSGCVGKVAFSWPNINLNRVIIDGVGIVELSDDRLELVDSPHDPVSHPKHYTSHPSGVEVIQITEHMGFCLGNAVKYILRSDLKGNAIEDLKKAAWYINREIEKREAS